MERSQLFRFVQEKIDIEIGNRTTGKLVFDIEMSEGGIRDCECQAIQYLRFDKPPLKAMRNNG